MLKNTLLCAAAAALLSAPAIAAPTPVWIAKACAHDYSESADAIAGCEQRLTDRAQFYNSRDEQAERDAETIRIYGSLEAAEKDYARQARIDRLCTRKVGYDDTRALAKCLERLDTPH